MSFGLHPPFPALPDPPLTAASLMSRGLFHDRIIPALTARDLSTAIDDLINFANGDKVCKNNRWRTSETTQCVRHSYPKRKLSRRVLSIPHPRNQMFVCLEVEKHWTELQAICETSSISLTTPKVSYFRALQGKHERKAEGIERTRRSVGFRYVLHADISRFYPSIYTHSIPWAIHGKDLRNDRSSALYGNLLDLWIRETQSQQTGGIPVGPDTSYLVAEVIASRIDEALRASLGTIAGTRYIDDYHLYFSSRSDAERALSELHRVAGVYELDINDLKTSIEDVPESIEPLWKTQLRAVFIAEKDHSTSFKAVFDLAATLAKGNPEDGVFAYLAKKIEAVIRKRNLTEADWQLVEALLLRVAVGDPSCLPTVLRIFEQQSRVPEGAPVALNSICVHHSELRQASEIAWALWTARKLEVALSQEAADAVETVDDDVVALAALELNERGLLPTPADGFSLWKSFMTKESLYSEHWLLAYEAYQQGWLPSVNGTNYVTSDAYFAILDSHGVRFFETEEDVEVPEDTGYEDSSDEDDEDDEDDDEAEDEDEGEGTEEEDEENEG